MMKKINRTLFLFLVLPMMLSACVTADSSTAPTQVSANYLYEGDYLSIRSPNSWGWYLLSSSPSGMDFAKGRSNSIESFGAQVILFTLGSTKNSDEFLSQIKKGIEGDSPKNRFETIESKLNYSEERDYPCVKVDTVTKDKKAKTSIFTRRVLILQAKALYCQHPNLQDTGFAVIYSHRGRSLHPNLEVEAQGFIDGVQVVEH